MQWDIENHAEEAGSHTLITDIFMAYCGLYRNTPHTKNHLSSCSAWIAGNHWRLTAFLSATANNALVVREQGFIFCYVGCVLHNVNRGLNCGTRPSTRKNKHQSKPGQLINQTSTGRDGGQQKITEATTCPLQNHKCGIVAEQTYGNSNYQSSPTTCNQEPTHQSSQQDSNGIWWALQWTDRPSRNGLTDLLVEITNKITPSYSIING